MIFLKAFIFGTPEVFVGNSASKFDKETLATNGHIHQPMIALIQNAENEAGIIKYISQFANSPIRQCLCWETTVGGSVSKADGAKRADVQR